MRMLWGRISELRSSLARTSANAAFVIVVIVVVVCKLIGHGAASGPSIACCCRGHAGLDKEAQARRRGRMTRKKKQEDKQNTQTNPIEDRSGSSDQVDFFLVKLNTG